jgi:hypothetical protein
MVSYFDTMNNIILISIKYVYIVFQGDHMNYLLNTDGISNTNELAGQQFLRKQILAQLSGLKYWLYLLGL